VVNARAGSIPRLILGGLMMNAIVFRLRQSGRATVPLLGDVKRR
jgi:hypothetical protein